MWGYSNKNVSVEGDVIMAMINLVAVLTILIPMYGYMKHVQYDYYYTKDNSEQKINYFSIFAVIGIAFIIRLILSVSYKGYETDMNCFIGWSDMAFKNGFAKFYTSNAFTDYPPGYIYVLYMLGAIRNIFHIADFSALGILLIKLPAVICDLITGFLIFQVASRKLNQRSAVTCAAVYLLNPAIIINSAIWGQVDAVFTLMVLLMCYFIIQKDLPKAYFAFVIGVLIKPQTLVFTPVLLFAIFDYVFRNGFDKKYFLNQIKWGLSSLLFMVLLILPFGAENVVKQYTKTLSSYPYASINAYNIWTMFGLNWGSQDGKFLFLSYAQWGKAVIILIVLVSAFLAWKAKNDVSKYTMLACFVIVTMFLFSVRMHERYLFPLLSLMLLTFALKPRKEFFLIYVLFSLTHFYNVAYVLFIYDYKNFNPKDLFPIMIAIFTLFLYVLFIFAIKKYYCSRNAEEEETEYMLMLDSPEQAEEKLNSRKMFQIKTSELPMKLVKYDIIAILIIVLVYSAVALFDLGDRKAPKTCWESYKMGDFITLDFGKNTDLKKLSFYDGNYEKRDFSVSTSNNINGPWTFAKSITVDPVFYWGETDLNLTTRYLRLTTKKEKTTVFEFVFLDSKGKTIKPVNASDYPALFDEQQLRPKRTSFRNSTYFDEIYHARTAYEYIHRLYSYENTHPPLGKIFISIGILIFGMNPFGWRIIGTLFGIAMLPFIYLFAKRFFRESWIATLVTILFAFDFMHFTQTRIATIDVFITFFVIVMYYFMYQYFRLSFYDTSLRKTFIPLGLSGITMGLGMASKWTGVYAASGLAVIFFWSLFTRFREYRFAKKDPEGISNGISHSHIIHTFRSKTVKTILFCMVFFVLIPATIYLLSYLPFIDSSGNGLVMRMLKNQQSMYHYHTTVDATHPYSSKWYQWPIMYRPIWYYSGHISDTVSEGISAFGNPLVWWAGIPAFLYMLYLAIRKKDNKATFLVIGYLAQYLPWTLVTRVIFIYHYFPSVPFVTFMVGYSMFQIVQKRPKLKKAAIAYTVVAVILFIMFYPVLSGEPVNKDYVSMCLRWFDSWVLVS